MAGFAKITASLGSLSGAVQAVGAAAEETADRLKQSTEEAREQASELDDIVFLLEQKVKQGDDLARSLLDVIASVEEGSLRAQDAASAYGTLVSTLTGDTQTIFALLSRVLPTVGEVQARLEDLRKSTLSVGEVLERLAEQNNTLAQSLSEMVRAYQAGELTLSFLLEKAQAIKEALPGSETAVLVDKLREALEGGGL